MDKLAQAEGLAGEDGGTIAFIRSDAVDRGRSLPGLLFLGGFRSDMSGAKAMHLEGFARQRGLAYVRFDYSGHGLSSGDFEAGTIGRWASDAIRVLDRLTEGPQILIGSSMGGWLMLIMALARPQRVAALVGVASAPDFTETLVWDQLSDADRETLQREGRLVVPSAYADTPTVLTRGLLEEGRRHLLLGAPIAIHCPVRLLHGLADPDVPHRMSLELCDKLETSDCRVTLIKDGDHRLSRDQDLVLLDATLDDLLASYDPAARIAGNPIL